MKDKEAWKEYKRGYNALLHECHLCRNCKRQDARTLNGRVLCGVCAEKEKKRYRKELRDPDFRARKNLYNREIRKQWKAQGRCTACGGKRNDSRYLLCARCRYRQNERRRVERAQKQNNYPRGANGICYRCNVEQAMEGKKVCAACNEYLDGLACHARTFIDGKGFKPMIFGRKKEIIFKGARA